jgi:hypothetical protein
MTAHSFLEQILQHSAQKCIVFVLGESVRVALLSSQPTGSACSSCRSLATRWYGRCPLTMWVIHTRASGKVSQRPHYESGVGWSGPVDEALVERLKAHACQTRDEGENPMHSVRSPFVKMSR